MASESSHHNRNASPRSIRWTLIGWFGLLLTSVIVTFGALLYWRASSALRASVDSSLQERAESIAAALEWEVDEGWELDLSDDYLRGIAQGAWFEIRAHDGTPIRSGGTPPTAPVDGPPGFRSGPSYRELVAIGPHDTRVRIGRSTAAEESEARTLLAGIIGGGTVLLLLAFVGGWWLFNRTLRPIERVSATAAGLSERDLSGRIDRGDVPEELRPLADTLNETFGRLEAAFTRQARFTADASHELRTPVAVIQAQAEAALRRERSPAEYRETLEACLRATRRMSGIVDGLLALARFDAGDRSAREPVDLDDVVREAVELSRPLADSEGVTVNASLAPLRVQGDPRLLGEAVSNLIANAIRYNRGGGHVDVSLTRSNGCASISVRDDGIGIPEADLPQIFERFYRVDPARSRSKGGSGLGLAITRWIVEGHDGAIEATSREGEGSTFTVRLPAEPC